MLEQDKLRNADILIQQETNRTNPIVSSHHHCLIFIKYIRCQYMYLVVTAEDEDKEVPIIAVCRPLPLHAPGQTRGH